MPASESTRWIKPLKRSQKVRLRKELTKRKKEENIKLEKCGWAPSKLIFGGKSRVTENGWEYKLL
jgi:hypothetical protein